MLAATDQDWTDGSPNQCNAAPTVPNKAHKAVAIPLKTGAVAFDAFSGGVASSLAFEEICVINGWLDCSCHERPVLGERTLGESVIDDR